MSRETKKITIGEENYEFGHWTPDFALSMLTRLIKMVGEPVARMIVGAGEVAKEKGSMDAEMNEGDTAKIVGEMIGSLGMRLTEDEVRKFFRDAQEQMLVKGQPTKPIYDAHYAGRIGHLMKVTKAQLEHQFSDFLEFLPALKS